MDNSVQKKWLVSTVSKVVQLPGPKATANTGHWYREASQPALSSLAKGERPMWERGVAREDKLVPRVKGGLVIAHKNLEPA